MGCFRRAKNSGFLGGAVPGIFRVAYAFRSLRVSRHAGPAPIGFQVIHAAAVSGSSRVTCKVLWLKTGTDCTNLGGHSGKRVISVASGSRENECAIPGGKRMPHGPVPQPTQRRDSVLSGDNAFGPDSGGSAPPPAPDFRRIPSHRAHDCINFPWIAVPRDLSARVRARAARRVRWPGACGANPLPAKSLEYVQGPPFFRRTAATRAG